MINNTNEVVRGDSGQTSAIRQSASTKVNRATLYTLVALVVFASIFAIGAQSWVRFFMDPRVANGVPARLFTQADFPAVVIGSRLVASGRGAELYDLDVQLAEQHRLIREGHIFLPLEEELRYPYPYSPFIAVLWSPLSGLSPLSAIAAWNLLNLAALVGGLWYLLISLPLRKTMRWLLLLSAITSFPLIVNLEQGQSSGIVMLGLATGVGLLRRERDLPAGLFFGLLVLKLQWLPILAVVLLFKRRWRTLFGMATTAGVLLLLVVATIGTGWIPGYLRIVEGAQRWEGALALHPLFSHSLSGGISGLVMVDEEYNDYTWLRFAVMGATLLVLALVLFLWRGPWRPGTARWDGLMAITTLACIFTNLQVNTHDLCLLVIPASLGIAYISHTNQSERVKVIWYALLWASYLLPALFLSQTLSSPIRLTAWVMGGMMVLLGVLLWRDRAESATPPVVVPAA